MRKKFSDSSRLHYLIANVDPPVEAGFRRWNLVLIPILAFFVLGVLIAALTPQFGHATSTARKPAAKIQKE